VTDSKNDEIWRQQREGACCGCSVCLWAIRCYPSTNPYEPKQPETHHYPQHTIRIGYRSEASSGIVPISSAAVLCSEYQWH
jgi:hypothetical protein